MFRGSDEKSSRPVGIDLFSGAGGLSLGFEQAGFDVRAAVEIDPIHCATHKFNFPDCAVIPGSVAGISGSDIREVARLSVHDTVDVVFGGPPCQGFSMIGHRSLDDPRNRLVYDFVRIVQELDANYFVFENVKGLTVGKQRHFLEEVVRAFEDQGYDVRQPWKVFDAASFGVPQHRERLILVGAKKGLAVPSYPDALTHAADRGDTLALPSGPTVRQALSDLPNADAFDVLAQTDIVRGVQFGVPSPYAREMRCLDESAWHFGYVREWNSEDLTSSWQTDHSQISRSRFASTAAGQTEPISRFFKLAADGLSNTLRAGTDGARGAFTSPRPIHYIYDRCVTVREMARLHGFPDWFRFHSTKWHGARQIGNAVPPPLARAVAGKIIESIGVVPARPERVVPLGDTDLLYATMAQAAELVGGQPLSGKRDRKSGVKKRTQLETEAARLQQSLL